MRSQKLHGFSIMWTLRRTSTVAIRSARVGGVLISNTIERVVLDLIAVTLDLMTPGMTARLAADEFPGRRGELLSDVGSFETCTSLPGHFLKDYAAKVILMRFPI